MPANWSQHVAPPSPIPIERFRSPPITGPCWSFIEEISGASHLISGTATNFNFSAGVFYFRNGYMNINPLKNHRILVIDDDIAIHEDFQKILITASHFPNNLFEDEAVLFGKRTVKFEPPIFEIDSAYQGQEGLDLIEKSMWEDRPYALAFIDVRMPPGWDGIETTARIWQRYPDLQVVICTAFSDYSWEEMLRILGFSDQLLILKKPFDYIEVLQLATAMTEKWRLYQQVKLRLDDLEKLVQERAQAKAADQSIDIPPRDRVRAAV